MILYKWRFLIILKPTLSLISLPPLYALPLQVPSPFLDVGIPAATEVRRMSIFMK